MTPLIFQEAEDTIMYSTDAAVLEKLAYNMNQLSVRCHAHVALNFVNGELVSLGEDLGGEMQALIQDWECTAADLAKRAADAASDARMDIIERENVDELRNDYYRSVL